MVGTNAQVWNVLQTSLTVLQYRLAIKAYSNAQIALVLKMFDNVFSRFAIKENIPAGMEDASLIYQNVLQEVLVRMNIQRNVLMEHVQKNIDQCHEYIPCPPHMAYRCASGECRRN